MITWSKLEEVLFDIEVNLKNRPVIYEYLEYSVLTFKSITLRRDMKLPDYSPEEGELSDNWKKQQRYVHKCKEAAWKKCFHKYLAAHNLSHREKPVKININDVEMIKGDDKNRGK